MLLALSEGNPFAGCTNGRELTAMFRALIERVGVTRCVILAPPPFHSVASPETIIYAWGFDAAWVQAYLATIHERREMIPDAILRDGNAILWKDLKPKYIITDATKDVHRLFMKFHKLDGVSIPLYGPGGHQTFLSFSFDNDLRSVNDPRVSLVGRLAALAHRRHIELYRQNDAVEVSLSAREQQVLRHMAVGSTKHEVAKHLGISPSSVDTYQRRIFFKLDVSDRTKAVIRGLSLGLIKL